VRELIMGVAVVIVGAGILAAVAFARRRWGWRFCSNVTARFVQTDPPVVIYRLFEGLPPLA
jgi:hypothetical protein